MGHSTYVLCKVVLWQLITNITSMVCKRCTIAMFERYVPNIYTSCFQRSSHSPQYCTYGRSQLSSLPHSHVHKRVPIHAPMFFGKFPWTFPFAFPGQPMTFPFTFPRWISVKVYMLCNFGTPKSPIMFNIMLEERKWFLGLNVTNYIVAPLQTCRWLAGCCDYRWYYVERHMVSIFEYYIWSKVV